MSIIKKVNNRNELDLISLAKELFRKAWFVLIISLICSVWVGAYSHFIKTPEYKAQISLFVNNTNNMTDINSITTSDISASYLLLQTYATIIKSETIQEDILRLSGVNYSVKELSGMIEIDAPENAAVLLIAVRNSNPEVAALLANSIAESTSNNMPRLVPGSSVRVLDYAKVPTVREGISDIKAAVLGFAVGFFLAVLIVVLLNFKKKKIKSKKEFADIAYPILGWIKDKSTVSDEADEYEELKTNVLYSLPGKQCKKVAITSPASKQDKSMITMNLAVEIASEGYNVLMVDCDLREFELTNLLKQDKAPGVTEILIGTTSVRETVRKLSENISVITCGTPSLNPLNLLRSGEIKKSLESIERQYDFVLIDMPSFDNAEDVMALCKLSTDAIVQVKCKSSYKQDVEAVLELLSTNGVNVLGLTVSQ